ncbi:MAG: N(4)-(beta-N-acetylglucosaminyl)-L-asparaginase [Phycisphaeraceae bacterium]|nr:N(4)-(beta-N-acetylglucosaminyl)-L-asparaginase [Phycisphaeraceae bacterium]
MTHPSRRDLLVAASAAAVLGRGVVAAPRPRHTGDTHRGAVCVASANGLPATRRAYELVTDGYDPADAVVQGVRIIEDDPSDTSVGLGGLPNEDGIVELDACVMHGPTHKCGAVASLQNIRNPAMVALHVLRRTDHCLLVGEGALRFARQMGFQEENLLTESTRLEWLKWRENMSREDDRLNDDERDEPVGKVWVDPDRRASLDRARARPIQHQTGTVHCSAITPAGDIASCTSTSGLSWKIPGRVGDSPIIGAGNYCDNTIGAAGSTGRGEANLANLSSFLIVELMGRGMTPTEACLEAARRVVANTKEHRLRRADGTVTFDLKFYALRKDGAFGGATLWKGGSFAVCDERGARIEPAASVFDVAAPE